MNKEPISERSTDADTRRKTPRYLMPETFAIGEEGDVALVAGRCQRCEHIAFPRPKSCGACGADDVLEHRLEGGGSIHACSEIHRSRPGFSTAYWLAYVVLPGGVRVVGQVRLGSRADSGKAAAPDPPKAGDPVIVEVGTLRTDESGCEVHGFRFRINA